MCINLGTKNVLVYCAHVSETSIAEAREPHTEVKPVENKTPENKTPENDDASSKAIAM